MAGLFDDMMAKVQEITSFVQSGYYLKLRRNLYSPVRWKLSLAGVTTPGIGTYFLFDRNVIETNGWASGNAGGTVILETTDIPSWFLLNNRTMPSNKYYIAQDLSIQWLQRANDNTNHAAFATDKLAILNSNAFVEIKPRDKDVDMRYPLRFFGDWNVQEPRTVNSASAETVSNLSNRGNDMLGGKIPMYPDEQTPGILFDPTSTVNITLNIQTVPIVITDEVVTQFTFNGWYFREM